MRQNPQWIRKWLPVLVVLLAVRLFWMPLDDWQDETRTKVSSLQKKISRLESLEKNRVPLKAAMEETESKYQELLKLFHPDASTPEALQLKIQKSLESLASGAGITVHRMEWLYVHEDQHLIQTPLQIVFESNLDQFYEYLFLIETQQQFFTVDKIELVKQMGENFRGIIEVSAYNLGGPQPSASQGKAG